MKTYPIKAQLTDEERRAIELAAEACDVRPEMLERSVLHDRPDIYTCARCGYRWTSDAYVSAERLPGTQGYDHENEVYLCVECKAQLFKVASEFIHGGVSAEGKA